MQTKIPTTSNALNTLLRADFITQWRNRRSVVMVLLVPVIIAISWKSLVERFGGPFVLSNCITVGLTAIGLMGYSNSIARDRDKDIFQRLRVAPIPTWTIMISRLIVQLVMILLVTVAVFVAGYYFDKISISMGGYLLAFICALIGGAVYLSLGQVIVGLIKNVETVSSTTRLVYFVFIMVGMFGELGVLGHEIGEAVKWSPYGTVKRIISDSLQSGSWNMHTSLALFATVGYTLIFSVLGINWFKWNTR
jgi:ABC-2 type transport system permease protein